MAYPEDGGAEEVAEPPERTPGNRGSIPTLDVVLDSRGPEEAIARTAAQNPRSELSPIATAWVGTLVGLALLMCLLAPLVRFGGRRPGALAPSPDTASASTALGFGGERAGAPTPAASASGPAAQASAEPPHAPAPPIPGPWRVAALTDDPTVKLVEGTMERRALVDALSSAGVPHAQIYRLLKAFDPIRSFDKPKRRDTFVVALDRSSRRLKAFEYKVSVTEVFQARETDDGTLSAERLDLHVEKKPVVASLVVGEDLSRSVEAGGLNPAIVELLDDALEGRTRLSNLHAGATLRIVAEEETALGVFARYTDINAVEYRPEGASASPLRVYRFVGKQEQGYFDGKGHQPYKGGWRTPIPFAKVSSRFNMHRMHPILHVVMPHNGVDFAASSGTPVYAACFGRVATAAEAGPSGNLVTIEHAGGITTGYAHLSRFAPNLHPGQEVESHQLIGYVGSTGRSTGPHLHFSAKKNGVFIDPLTLKLDTERVLPKSERGAFEQQKTALDEALDGIALPNVPVQPNAGEAETKEDTEPLEPPEERDAEVGH